MVALITGTAHPKPGRKRTEDGDLNAAEIYATDLGKTNVQGSGTPMFVEHEGSSVGTVLASWTGPKGDMRVLGRIANPEAEALVRSGDMRGLSLGTEMFSVGDGPPLHRSVYELSVCEKPRRPGCFIDEIDGKCVGRAHNASASAAEDAKSTRRQRHESARLSPPCPSTHGQ
jgi:hypothetical protein